MGESVVRLLSRNGVTSIDTTQYPAAKSKSKSKSKQHARKRHRAQQSLSATSDCDDNDDCGNNDDDHAELYDAAQMQLMQEMAAAGLEGSLPMSFGSTKRQQQPSRSQAKKRRRVVSDDDKAPQPQQQQSTPLHTLTLAAAVSASVSMEQRSKSAKVHVKYDSDGEVAERVVHEVAIPLDAAVATADAGADTTNGAAAASPVQQQQQDVPNTELVSTRTTRKQHDVPPVDAAVLKFWKQRYHLFYQYDSGIQLDHESWYSVTPQAIAEHIAARLACDVVVDPFSGCGGNIIQLARVCKHVIAIEIDPVKVRMAQHNAHIYGVRDRIKWIVGDALTVLPHVRADVVFLSPPWGGLAYSRESFELDDMCISGVSGTELFAIARRVSRNVAYYVPKTTSTAELEALAPHERVECERIYLNHQLKVVTAYYGDLVGKTATATVECEQEPVDDDDGASGDSAVDGTNIDNTGIGNANADNVGVDSVDNTDDADEDTDNKER